MKYSQSDDDGVIGYHAATVQPPITQPSAAARLPSMNIRPSVFPLIGTKRKGSCFSRFAACVLEADVDGGTC